MADEASGAPTGGAQTPPAQDAGAHPPTGESGHGAHGDGHGAAPGGGHAKSSFMMLAVGAIGVVFGDIGTSPLYAMREALSHAKAGTGTELAVLGVVSLVLWTLTLFVTIKYVTFFMRADNNGEGGTLALMALARKALGEHMGKRATTVFFLGVVGAALFYGDGIITPAISVLSAVEGLEEV